MVPGQTMLYWCKMGLSRGFPQVLLHPVVGKPLYTGFIFLRKQASLKYVLEHLNKSDLSRGVNRTEQTLAEVGV